MKSIATRLSLLSRVRDPADQAAWSEFEARYRDLIRRYAQARGLQFCDAEDVCQVVFLRLSRYLRGFQYKPSRGRFRNYLGAIVRNVVHSQLACPRTSPRVVRGEDDRMSQAPDPASTESDPQWEREWMDHHYRRAMSAIRSDVDPRSLVVFARLIGGESMDSVAASQGMSVAAVEKVRQRIRSRLQDEVIRQIQEEDAG